MMLILFSMMRVRSSGEALCLAHLMHFKCAKFDGLNVAYRACVITPIQWRERVSRRRPLLAGPPASHLPRMHGSN